MILRESVRHGAPRVRNGPGSSEPAGTRPTLLAPAIRDIPDTEANDHACMSRARSPSPPTDSPAFVRVTDRISVAARFAISVLKYSDRRDGDELVPRPHWRPSSTLNAGRSHLRDATPVQCPLG